MSVEFLLYPRLQTHSRRALGKSRRRNGMPYTYRPRGTLLKRLSQETGMSLDQVFSQLIKERAELLREFSTL